jgi:hypothetical protein
MSEAVLNIEHLELHGDVGGRAGWRKIDRTNVPMRMQAILREQAASFYSSSQPRNRGRAIGLLRPLSKLEAAAFATASDDEDKQ